MTEEEIRVCSRCESRVRWNGKKWTTVDEPVGACLSGLGFNHVVENDPHD